MRGLAAVLVILSHADAYHLIRIRPVMAVKGQIGVIGVDLFFLVSGFLIWSSALRKLPEVGGLRTYLVHRIARIAPLYIVALAFAISILALPSAFPQEVSWYTIWRHLTFIQALRPDVSRAINPVLWTLTFEVIFYLLVPILFLFRRAFPAIILAAMVGTWWGWHSSGTFCLFFRVCYLFAIGMAFAHYGVTPSRKAAALAVAVALAATLTGFPFAVVCPLWALAAFASIASLRELSGSIPIRLMAFVGLVSYSLYIWHYMLIEMTGPSFEWVRQKLHSPPLIAVSFLVLCLGLSWASYVWIEKPGQAFARGLLLRRRAELAAA